MPVSLLLYNLRPDYIHPDIRASIYFTKFLLNHFLLYNLSFSFLSYRHYCAIVTFTQSNIEPCFEWWRYIGPVKPRQPLWASMPRGRCLPERSACFEQQGGLDILPVFKRHGLFHIQRSGAPGMRALIRYAGAGSIFTGRRKIWKDVYLHLKA